MTVPAATAGAAGERAGGPRREGHTDPELIAEIRDALDRHADPVKAPAMQAYMKSDMPFRGVQTQLRRKLFAAAFGAHPQPSFTAWRDTALRLWREAQYREERYAAVELTGLRAYSAYQRLDAVAMYEEMIVSGAWWDYVDEIAIRRIGPMLRSGGTTGATVRRLMLAWSRDPDPWKRRTAIICQIGSKSDTDLDLLYTCVEANADDSGFFVRKGIGWALRAYAWVDPGEVERYVTAHRDVLSPLSRREALKNIT
ncbi:MAG: DNA alkylation repair protein [Micromonosporaceae bacterium]